MLLTYKYRLYPSKSQERLLSQTLETCRRWYNTCLACEVESQPLEPTGQTVAIDVGISSLLTTSDGEHIENPKWYRTEQAKLRVAQRRVSRRKPDGSNRRQAVRVLQAKHDHISNRRADYIKKLVHGLVTRYDCIAIEDLRIANMTRNPYLATSILDAGWGYFRLQLSSKAEYAGQTIAAVPPAYTSKTCSQCGTIFETQTLADRWVSCACGLSMDRDENAALNLHRLGRNRWEIT